MSGQRKVLVTGASSGIGKATAVRFAVDGFDVCLNARREEVLQEILNQLPPGDHFVCAGDYSDAAFVKEMGETIRGKWGRIDVLANCAGRWTPADIIDSPLGQWRESVAGVLGGKYDRGFATPCRP